jgi:hypothetical protein
MKLRKVGNGKLNAVGKVCCHRTAGQFLKHAAQQHYRHILADFTHQRKLPGAPCRSQKFPVDGNAVHPPLH